jgi:beta-glucosidase
MTKPIQFPEGFLWGCATSAYQIEGSPLADGAGPSIWQRFAHSPGRTHNGDTGDIACDHYRRYADDVALMHDLGMQAYRFSIAWGRILPEGKGAVNPAGLDHYERLVDALLARGIAPMITLYHWDLPAALDDRGGWLNRDVASWFADYATVVFRRLDDRVTRWATLNEPWVVSDGGYLHGALAPGHRNLFEAPIVTHNLMRAHGAAVEAYRAVGRHEIGLVVNLEPQTPASHDPADVAASRRFDAHMNRQYLDAALLGSYPDELAEIFGAAWPTWSERDFAQIRQPIDFVGINYYQRGVRRHDPSAGPVAASPVRQPQSTYTETAWEVFPAGLTEILRWVHQRYGAIPLYVTENGAAFYDPPTAPHGRVHDPLRVAYLRDHLLAVHAAIAAGVDVRGYMVWSLFDNLEWSLGFSKRFGIVHVDFASLVRTPKDSARYYSRVIASHGAALAEPLDP